MNLDSLTIPRERLDEEFRARTEERNRILVARDVELGENRPRIFSYMENIGWPELFGYDMNEYLADPELAFDLQLRQKIFWADNSEDDSPLDPAITADTGVYFDMTLFGAQIRHTSIGIPEFEPHPISLDPDPSLIEPFDFHSTGDMPALIPRYEQMREISESKHGGYYPVDFPSFHRGPLDIYVQLRGYENFIADTMERSDLVHTFLELFVDERRRYREERRAFLGETNTALDPWVADDWVNIPFISPALFTEYVIPSYRRIAENEGPVVKFHTCGRIEPIVAQLLDVFPRLTRLDVSGWNDVVALDSTVPPQIVFDVGIINTFTLSAPLCEQRAKLQRLASVAANRNVTICAQAIVKLLPTYKETLAKMNSFIELARATFSTCGSG